MKFTLNWLQDYVDTTDLSPDQLAEQLTMLGLEVDSVVPLYQELSPLITGRVVTCEKHPNDLIRRSVGEEQVTRHPGEHANEDHPFHAEFAEEKRNQQHEENLGHLADAHGGGRLLEAHVI